MFTQSSSRFADTPQAILFVHGTLSSTRIWEPYRSAVGASSLAVALPGYGGSLPNPIAPFRLHDGACAMRQALEKVDGPVAVVAHSYGAAVALRFTMESPGLVDSLTLIEPSFFPVLRDMGPRGALAFRAIKKIADGFSAPEDKNGRTIAVARFVDYWNGRGAWAGLQRHRQASFVEQAPQVRRDFEAIFAERVPLAAFKYLTTPTLIVAGTKSPLAARMVASGLSRAMPNASLRPIAGAGHMLPITHVAPLTVILWERFGAAHSIERAA